MLVGKLPGARSLPLCFSETCHNGALPIRGLFPATLVTSRVFFITVCQFQLAQNVIDQLSAPPTVIWRAVVRSGKIRLEKNGARE